jgi:hypothetical protein
MVLAIFLRNDWPGWCEACECSYQQVMAREVRLGDGGLVMLSLNSMFGLFVDSCDSPAGLQQNWL